MSSRGIRKGTLLYRGQGYSHFLAISTCNDCFYSYFEGIVVFFGKNNVPMDFLKSHGVIPVNVKCSKYQKDCNFREDQETPSL